MADIEIKKVRSTAVFGVLSVKDRNNFIQYQVYGQESGDTPDYYNSLSDLILLENFLWTHRPVIAKAYILKLSGTISNRVYKTFSEGADSTEIALNFYYGLLHCDIKDRLSSLTEVLLRKLEEEDRDNEADSVSGIAVDE